MSDEHHHSHTSNNIRSAFFLNLGFALIEIVGGLLTNSTAILSDAVHDLGDSISLGMAWFLGSYSEKESNQKYTYGYRRYSLLGALINSIVLVGGSLFVLSEAIPRLAQPKHLIYLDPILSILITLYILFNAMSNLRKTLALFLQASPKDVDIQSIEKRLQTINGVKTTHHTHLWSLDGEYNVFTTHLVMEEGITIPKSDQIKGEVRQIIKTLKLEHVTIEIEFSEKGCSMIGVVYAEMTE